MKKRENRNVFHGSIRAFKILYGSRYGTVNDFKKIDHGTENKKRCGKERYGHGTKFGSY